MRNVLCFNSIRTSGTCSSAVNPIRRAFDITWPLHRGTFPRPRGRWHCRSTHRLAAVHGRCFKFFGTRYRLGMVTNNRCPFPFNSAIWRMLWGLSLVHTNKNPCKKLRESAACVVCRSGVAGYIWTGSQGGRDGTSKTGTKRPLM